MCISRFIHLMILLLVFLLSGCSSHKKIVYAPVTDATLIDPIPKNGMHRVKSGESIYSIAWRYGLDSRSLAARNHLVRPYHIHSGQIIYLKEQAPSFSTKQMIPKPTAKKVNEQKSIDFRESNAPVLAWHWPAKGPVIAGFSDLNKGINIGGHRGDPIFATAAGNVVYCGNGLRGYGNLIIIEHNKSFLTAYAHNSVSLVKEGQYVRQGQKIALMGNSGSKRIMLHFEIRRDGKPVNPLMYLSA